MIAISTSAQAATCDNSRTIPHEDLERRVLAGRKNRMMAPGIVEEAMRTYAQETNRLNRERRSNGDAWKVELAKVEKQIAGIVEAIADGMYHPSMKQKMSGLEARKIELTALLADEPAGQPDQLPNAAAVYAQKIAKLTEALNHARRSARGGRERCGC